MHSIVLNTLNACFSTKKAIRQELHQVEEHLDLHLSIQHFGLYVRLDWRK